MIKTWMIVISYWKIKETLKLKLTKINGLKKKTSC